jgi:hypothetical protein
MSPAREELPCVDEHAITIAAPHALGGARCEARIVLPLRNIGAIAPQHLTD